MDLIARFDRGAREEVRISLAVRPGNSYLDVRVYHKMFLGEAVPSPEGLRLPVELFDVLCRAIEAAGEELRRRGVGRPEEATRAPKAGTAATRAPSPGGGQPVDRPGAGPQGRAEERVPLACPLEYTVRRPAQVAQVPLRGRGRTADINRGGLQVLLPERISILNVLVVTLHLPWGFLSLVGEVVWAEVSRAAQRAGEGYRHGLRFTTLGPQERRLLDRLLAEAAR